MKKSAKHLHVVSSYRVVQGNRVYYHMPKQPLPEEADACLAYECIRYGRPWYSDKGPITKRNISIFRHCGQHNTVKVDPAKHPKYDMLVFDADKNKVRALTLAEWDAISGGSEKKDFNMDTQVKLNKGTPNELRIPFYPSWYLARHEARRLRYQKRSEKPKKKPTQLGKKRQRPESKEKEEEEEASPTPEATGLPPKLTGAQQAALKRTRTMTTAEILNDAELRKVLDITLILGAAQAATQRENGKEKEEEDELNE